jgi:hypothetical protein
MSRCRSLLAGAFLVTGCSAVLTPGVTTYPVTSDVDFTTLSNLRHGESCAKTILYIFGPSGRASVAAAAQAAGLKSVKYVDNRYDNNIFRQRYCVIAYGD